jgi:hypothetical protein
MGHNLDFDEGKVFSITKWFYGEYVTDDDTYEYTIISNWNDWDEWTIDEIDWNGKEPENIEEIEVEIHEMFNKYFYN